MYCYLPPDLIGARRTGRARKLYEALQEKGMCGVMWCGVVCVCVCVCLCAYACACVLMRVRVCVCVCVRACLRAACVRA